MHNPPFQSTTPRSFKISCQASPPSHHSFTELASVRCGISSSLLLLLLLLPSYHAHYLVTTTFIRCTDRLTVRQHPLSIYTPFIPARRDPRAHPTTPRPKRSNTNSTTSSTCLTRTEGSATLDSPPRWTLSLKRPTQTLGSTIRQTLSYSQTDRRFDSRQSKHEVLQSAAH